MKGIIRTLILVTGVTLVSFSSIAQRTCGTEAYYQQSILDEPSLIQGRQDAIDQYEKWMNTHPQGSAKKAGTILKIPVVVHVIYENSTENISDAQVISQIEVLNDDYRKLNSDTGNVPSWFKPIAADVEVEFILAVRDPDGNATNGITRTSTTKTSFASGNPKSTADGGKDGWPNSDYLNFWVCDLGGGLLGYATFPGGNPASDGVVCGYQYIGKPPANPFSGGFNKGRTATHEIGHYFALSHTFQGGCSGTSSTNCSTAGDGICDTPPTSSSNYGCPSSGQNSCTETPIDLNDQHMNYMDYVDDGCMNMFTDDQKTRMRAVINTSRAGLLTSLGAIPVSALDASISLLTPTDTICGSGQFAPVITLFNYGSSTLTSTTIKYQVDANTVSTYSWTGNLVTLGSEAIILPMIGASLGSHTFQVWSTLPNGQADELSSNDSSSSTFTFMDGNSVSLTLDYDTFQLANLVSWDIRNGSGAVVDSGGGYSQNTTTIELICLEAGCYTFNLYNDLNNGEGAFTLVDVTGDTIVDKNDIYTYNQTFCVTVGTEELRDRKDVITLYPNPSNGTIYISTESSGVEIESIIIQNTVGQVVYIDNQIFTSGPTELDLGFLNDGVYFITVRTPNNSVTKKISLIR